MGYSFFMDGAQLPIAPPSLSIKIKNQNKTVTLINEGEVNILKMAGLTEIAFDIRIPQTKYPFASYSGGFKGADYFLNKLERLKTGQSSFQFIVSRVLPNGKSLFDTNIKVSLEDYKIEEEAEDGFDVVVGVKLKQYRSYGTKTVKINSSSNAQAVSDRPADPSKKTSYTVVSGDCLWNIAKKYLGNGSRYTEIYNLNKDKIKNPNLIYPGQVLVLP